MTTKRSYTRADLTRSAESCGDSWTECALCLGNDLGDLLGDPSHDEDCPLAKPEVLGIMVTSLSKPRESICGQCPAMDRPCAVPAWREESHETLMIKCGRYAVDSDRVEDVT